MAEESPSEWNAWWDARVAAVEGVLGKSDGVVSHAIIPFHFGVDIGGAADLIYFRDHLPGVIAVTSELIGIDGQVPNSIGNYELMICHRDDEGWGAGIISRLAHYTMQARLDPGQTMSIGPSAPNGSTIAAFLFVEYARFQVRDRRAGLLLCVGITEDELAACREGRRVEVEEALKVAGVFPFTDLTRESVLDHI